MEQQRDEGFLGVDQVLADTLAVAHYCAEVAGRPVAPATIRGWAHQGLIARRGTDQAGRALYDLDEAAAVVMRPGAGRGAQRPAEPFDDNPYLAEVEAAERPDALAGPWR